MAMFRILHASDPHMATVPFRLGTYWHQPSHDLNALKAFVAFAHRNRNAFDAVLVSGDLATTGDRTDLVAAYQLYTAAAANSVVAITPAGEPTLVHWANSGTLDLLPGNHDRFRSRAHLYRAGGRVFDQVFDPKKGMSFWSAKQGVAHGVSICRGASVLHIVKADFTLHRGDSGKWFYMLPGWLGQGRVEQTVLDDLVAATKHARCQFTDEGCHPVTLWVIHFDPFATDQVLLLLESAKLAKAAQELNVVAILCGHTHETKLKPVSDKTVVYVCGTTAQAGSPQWDCQSIEVVTDDNGTLPATIHVDWYRYDGTQFSPIGSR